MIIKKKNLKDILFVDIETVSEYATYHELRPEMQSLWARKAQRIDRAADHSDEEHWAASYTDRAGIFAEFAKVACITVGYLVKPSTDGPALRIKTFGGHHEAAVLRAFAELLDRHFDNPDQYYLCGHNVKEFDVPFLCRRMVIHGLHLPRMLNISGKKPWQVGHLLDTMELWRFGDYKNYTSLALLAATLHIKSPKDDIDGSQVGNVYWVDQDLPRIVHYCEKDVVTVAQIVMRFAGAELISDDAVEYVPFTPVETQAESQEESADS